MVPHLQELLNGTKVAEFCKRADIAELGRDAEMLMKVLSADKEGSKFYYVSVFSHELSQDYCVFPFMFALSILHIVFFLLGRDKEFEDMRQLMLSIKVLMNFTSLPGFPRPLQRIVMSLKDFADEDFTGEVMMKIMQVPYINETFRLLELPETEKHFEGKL